jgi:hypothetical protein
MSDELIQMKPSEVIFVEELKKSEREAIFGSWFGADIVL